MRRPLSYPLPPKIDLVWHDAILDTQYYEKLCQDLTKAAGWTKAHRFIHHDPQGANQDAKATQSRLERRECARALYRTTFDKETPWRYWQEYPPDDTKMQVFVKTSTGKTLTLDVTPVTTIHQLTHKIRDKDNIPTDQQRIIFCGETIVDHLFPDPFYVMERAYPKKNWTTNVGRMKP